MCAAAAGDLASIRFLVAKGAEVNATGWAHSVLTCAAKSGNLELVTFLLDKGAEVNRPVEDGGATPLMYATTAGHLDMVKLLIKRGADVHAQTVVGESAERLADQYGRPAVAEYLRTLKSK